MTIYNVINQKIVDHSEVIVLFFDYCNLQCVFCPQDHNLREGVSREEILSKVPLVADYINRNNKTKYFKVHIMGGEVFQDDLIKQGFLEIYQEFIDELRFSVSLDKTLYFNFVTNLVFTRLDEVKQFLDDNQLKVSISYDSAGRFNPDQKKIFIANIVDMEEYIDMCSLVMTKQNIKAVMQGDPVFDSIYSKFTCDWDSFLPSTENAKYMMPSESELLNFYKFLVDVYPDCLNIEHFVSDKLEHKMTCTRGNTFTVLYDNTIPAGCSGAAWLVDGVTEDPSTGQILENFFEKYDCFNCEFFKRCPFTCFIKNDYSMIERDVDGCIFKETFKYAKQKKNRIC